MMLTIFVFDERFEQWHMHGSPKSATEALEMMVKARSDGRKVKIVRGRI